jgi:hypothetical protein
MTEEWFMLFLLYCIPLLFKVGQRSVSCCGCYIVNYYCLSVDRGVVHVVVVILSTFTFYGLTEEWFMLLLLYCIPLLFKVWQRSGSCCGIILSTITVLALTEEWFMWLLLYCLPLLFRVSLISRLRYGCNIVYHYCLWFDIGEVHVVVVILSTITVYVLQRNGSRCGCYIVNYYC